MEDSKIEIAVLKEKFISNDRSLTLQAKEYERRLNDLNGEANRIKNMQETFLPREVYTSRYDLLNTKIEALEKLVYVGLGLFIAIEFILRFIK